jgi:hypothetical protein
VIFRALTGLGMGGAMPNAIALTSESMPARRRGTSVTTMICGFSLGAAVGGFVAASIIPEIRLAVGVRRRRPVADRDCDRGIQVAARLGARDNGHLVSRDAAVYRRPRDSDAADLGRLLHEPAEPVFSQQLAADDHQRCREFQSRRRSG